MTEVKTNNAVEWSWANVVLTRSSKPMSFDNPEVLNELSTCPDHAAAGQVDRLVSTFEISRTPAPDVICCIANLYNSSTRRSGRDSEEERAEDFEYEATPCDWAEGFARLHPDRPPGDVPLSRWRQFIDDSRRFLGDQWAEKATVLGWGPHDLFGADRERRSLASIEQACCGYWPAIG